jgi:hypothetical protein
MPESLEMVEWQRYQTEWENLRLVVEKRSNSWRFFVYDVENCEVLHTAERLTVDDAKSAAVGFAAVHAFGLDHRLKPELLGAMLLWEPF